MARRWNSLTSMAVPIATAALCMLGASGIVFAAGPSNDVSLAVKPSPVHFAAQFGSLKFP